MQNRYFRRARRLPAYSVLAIIGLLMVLVGSGVATAKGGPGGIGGGGVGGGGGGVGGGVGKGGGGTAKPPRPPKPAPVTGPIVRSFPALSAPAFTGDPNHQALHQFNVTGFIQDATVSGADCPGIPARHWGGTLLVNGLSITVPCNTVVQMPADTLSWSEFVTPSQPPAPAPPVSYLPTTLKQLAGAAGTFPSFEVNVVGNTVVDRHISGLITISQQSLNQGQGIVTSIDYAKGQLHVGSAVGAPDQAVVELNDPNGRFGLAHSPDPRFSVDDQNPTVHAATGYPMCIPRTDPNVTDDVLCPQANRPSPVNQHCRDFVDDGLGGALPKGGNLSPAFANPKYCGHFVMPPSPAPGTPATGPDPTQQAPFEVGDYITYGGTVLSPASAGGPSLISAHTVEASVGIFTSHGTLPSYQAIGQFGVGSNDPSLIAINGAAQETVNRIFFVAETTDVTTPVDIYFPDVDPTTGAVSYRWITPFEMTGESNQEFTTPDPTLGAYVGGGITTQLRGPQPERIRLRATRAPLGLLNSPTRNILIVARTLCNPDTTGTPSSAGENSTFNNIKTNPECLTSQTVANGLHAGRYQAPNFTFIFPENTQPGDPVVPDDLWNLGFLSNGEGGPGGQGPLTPTPW